MASQELKHRTKPEEQEGETKEIDASSAADMNNNGKPRRQKKRGMASRGLRSLALALSFPILLTIMDIYLFGSSNRYRNIEKPFYFPPLWALHLTCLAAAFLSGLSSWLVWADGWFHKQPSALLLYLGQLGLSLGWYPIVFGAGATRVGLVMCTALFGAMVGCSPFSIGFFCALKKMLPLSLLKTAQGHPMLVELKNGETYNGHLVNCDTWMNIHLREVICTSKDGDRFWRMPECYIRGNTIKYLRVPDEVIDKVQEEKSRSDRRPPGVGRGRGRGREDSSKAKGIGRGLDDGAAKNTGGGRGRGGNKVAGGGRGR
ncbi:unnamed protein product [Fraxinus pennsylvanica]|uniref:Sm domain-containing protein n=1 Tax=Fraxinus pennsylvanica TaxID=56036 RepID=A0AAD2E230_9LAMI|nr:unnamed protein product [Fraxinus pennsylvanica]